MMADLPTWAQVEIQRMLDRAARRVLDEQLARGVTAPASRAEPEPPQEDATPITS